MIKTKNINSFNTETKHCNIRTRDFFCQIANIYRNLQMSGNIWRADASYVWILYGTNFKAFLSQYGLKYLVWLCWHADKTNGFEYFI